MAEFSVKCPSCEATVRFEQPRQEIICPKCKTQIGVGNQPANPDALEMPAQQPLQQHPYQPNPIHVEGQAGGESLYLFPKQQSSEQPQQPLTQQPAAHQNCDSIGAEPVLASIVGDAAPLVSQSTTLGGNPYQSPVAPVGKGTHSAQSTGIYRKGKTLIMHRSADLPEVCVKSHRPPARRVKLNYSWHHPLIAITVCAGLLAYVVVALILTKRATINVPLTDEWIAKRRIRIAITWLLLLACMGCIIGGIAVGNDRDASLSRILVSLGLILFVVATIFGMTSARILKAIKITDSHIWLNGAHPELLNTLPEWTDS